MIGLTGSDLGSAGAAGALGSVLGIIDFCGASALVNFVGVPPNLKVVSLFDLVSSSFFISFSGSFRVDWEIIDLGASSFCSSAALAAAATGLVWAGLIGASEGAEETDAAFEVTF